MKIIAISAVTAGGKTTIVNALKDRLPKAAVLYFDDYDFDGEVEDYAKWLADGADVNVWDLSPLKADIDRLISGGEYEYILLDYPFAYDHRMLEGYIDCCIFIDTPLDVALARRVLRDMQSAPAEDILAEMRSYLQYARPAFVHMQNGHQASADYVIDGTKSVSDIAEEICGIISGI